MVILLIPIVRCVCHIVSVGYPMSWLLPCLKQSNYDDSKLRHPGRFDLPLPWRNPCTGKNVDSTSSQDNKIRRSKFKYYSYVRVIIVTLIAHIKIQLRCINNTASRILKYVYEFHSNFHPFNPIKTLLNSASRKKSIHQYV